MTQKATQIAVIVWLKLNFAIYFTEFPWMVGIMERKLYDEILSDVYACGGSLIHENVVLTGSTT